MLNKFANFFFSQLRFLRDQKYKFTKNIFTTSHGFKMWFHKEPEDKKILSETELNIVKRYINDFDVLIDVGAFVGFFSLFANKISNKNKKFFVFEPQQNSFQLLSKNFKLNKVNDYKLFNLALSNSKSISKLYGFGQGASLTENWGGISNYAKLTDVDILDNYYNLIDKNQKIFIKIDAEGEEYKILLGANKFLNHNNKLFIHFENGIKKNFKEKNPHFLNIFKILIDNSFKIFQIENLDKELSYKNLEIIYNGNDEPFNEINYIAIKN